MREKISGSSLVQEPVTLTSDVKHRKQRSRHYRPQTLKTATTETKKKLDRFLLRVKPEYPALLGFSLIRKSKDFN